MKLSAFLSFLSIFVLSYAQDPKNYTLEEFLKAPEKELTQHKKELDRLIEQKKLNIPQSQAMLFYPNPIENKALLKKQLAEWGKWRRRPENVTATTQDIQKALNVLNEAITTENKETAQKHLMLYHTTQPDLYAQSYINTQLQKLALELKGKKIDTETLLMRDLNKPRSYEEEKAKRKKFLKALGYVSDKNPEVAEYLISTNPAIPSNLQSPGSSSIFYFLTGRNLNPPKSFPLFAPKDNKLLEQEIKAEIPEFTDALKKFTDKTDTGILLQFIVKDYELARKILYNAQPFGPKNYIQLERGKEKLSDPVTILNIIRTNPEAFKRKSSDYDTLQEQQMRLIVTGDKLLDLENPAVKEFDVKAYSGSDQSLKEFQKKVDDTIQKIRSDYYAQKQQMSWPKRIQYGARDLFYRRQSPWEQRQQYKRMLRGDIGSPFE